MRSKRFASPMCSHLLEGAYVPRIPTFVFALVFGLIAVLFSNTSLAQAPASSTTVRISSVRLGTQDRLSVHFTGAATNYHVLLSGSDLYRLDVPAGITAETNHVLETSAGTTAEPGARFYRIAAYPKAAPVDTDRDGIDDLFELGSKLNPLDPSDASQDPDGDGRTRLEEYLLNGGPLTRVDDTNPANGESDISASREVLLHLTYPLHSSHSVGRSNLFATAGGRQLLSRIELSPDRRTLTLFPLENYPGSTRIRIHFNPLGLTDYLGRPLDVRRDRAPHSWAFDTVPLTPIPGTVILGQVLTETGSKPIEGVVVQIDGVEQEFSTQTDADGRFQFTNAPAGRFFAKVDGRRVTNGLPAGAYYPQVGKLWETVALQTNRVNGNGLIYLPLIRPETLQPVSTVAPTKITFPSSVLAEQPRLAGVELTVPANALFDSTGLRGGKVGIAPVSPDRLPEPLPPGLKFPMVITVQTDGPQNFDQPVPVRFPNLPDPLTGRLLPPGAKTALWSFNHDTGQWEIQGAMTISADGRYAESDTGVGIRQPGWNGVQSGSQLGTPILDGDSGDGGSGGGKCSRDAGDWWDVANAGFDCVRDTVAVFQSLGKLLDIFNGLRDIQKAEEALREDYEVTGDVASLKHRMEELKAHKDFIMAGFELAQQANPVEQAINKLQCATGLTKQAAETWCKGYDEEECDYSTFWRNACYRIVSLTSMADALSGMLEAVQEAEKSVFLDVLCAGFDVFVASIPGSVPNPDPQTGGVARPAAPDPNLLNEFNRVIDSFDRLAPMQGALKAAVDQTDATQVRLTDFQSDALNNVLIRRGELAGLWFLLRVNGQLIQRDRFNLNGRALFQIPADADYSLEVLDLKHELVLVSKGRSPTVGARGTTAPFEIVRLAGLLDSDGDGLPDVGEQIVGTDVAKADSDNDGVVDSIEIRRETDPLDGRPMRLGLVAALPVPGEAGLIAVQSEIAAVALVPSAIAICNVSTPQNPVLLATLALPSAIRDMAFSEQFLAVALESHGVFIIDLSRPASPVILHRIALRGRTDAITFNSGTITALTALTANPTSLAYNRVFWIDARRGILFAQRNTVGTESFSEITDLQDESGYYMMMVNHGSMYFIDPDPFKFTIAGSLRNSISVAPGRLGPAVWLGNGRAYVGFDDGYRTFDISNPRFPSRLGEPTRTQETVRDLVWDGAASVLSVTQPFGQAARLMDYDASDPKDVSKLRVGYPLSGEVQAVALAGNHALATTRTSGVLVVQYRVPSTGGAKPSVRWLNPTPSTPLPPYEPFTASIAATGDQRMQEAEFQLDEGPVQVDRQYPFSIRLLAPAAAKSGGSMRLRARVRDEGGQLSDWVVQEVPLQHRATALLGLYDFALSGVPGKESRVAIYLNSMPRPESILPNFSFIWFGPDLRQGTPDDRSIPFELDEVDPWQKAVFLRPTQSLPYGTYHVRFGKEISDLSGNTLSAETSGTLTVDLMAYASSGWRYRVVKIGEVPDAHQPTEPEGFVDGVASFGSVDSSCAIASSVRTHWPSGTDLLARRLIELPNGISHVDVRLSFDNAVQVWFDGIELTTGMRDRDGCAVADSLILTVPEALSKPGKHLLTIRARDLGGASFLDARVTGWSSTAP